MVKESGFLQEEEENLNKLSILVRGKLALEDILYLFNEGGLYTKYLIGEIEADFLDLTDKDDIATSSRQDFIQNDERFRILKNFIQKELKFIEKKRVSYKEEQGVQKAEEIPALQEWYRSLKGNTKDSAKRLFGRINQIVTDENHRKTIYKHGVLAFEHLQQKKKLNELDKLDINNLSIAVRLFSELDDIEASLYHEITVGRLEVIRKLSEKVEKNVLEKVIQAHLYNHLWLLDPSWDRATKVTSHMEKTISKVLKATSDNLSDEERNGRIDITYKKTSDKHIIIELKRSSVQLSSQKLSTQVEKYISAFSKIIKANQISDNKSNIEPEIETICLVGKLPEDLNWEESLKAKNIRVITYGALIYNAEMAYKEYLTQDENRGRISKLLEQIETSFGNL